MSHNELTEELLSLSYEFKDGFFTPGEVAGHGVDVNEAFAAKYPC